MLRSILMIIIQELALIYGIVTHVSELSQNLVGMNEKFWAVWIHYASNEINKFIFIQKGF